MELPLAQRMTGYREGYLAWNWDFRPNIFKRKYNRNATVLRNGTFCQNLKLNLANALKLTLKLILELDLKPGHVSRKIQC